MIDDEGISRLRAYIARRDAHCRRDGTDPADLDAIGVGVGSGIAVGDVARALAEVDRLRDELAAERARLDWLEEYRLSDNLDLMDEWDCDTLREAIDKAKGIEL
jgi:hypothetical protein